MPVDKNVGVICHVKTLEHWVEPVGGVGGEKKGGKSAQLRGCSGRQLFMKFAQSNINLLRVIYYRYQFAHARTIKPLALSFNTIDKVLT